MANASDYLEEAILNHYRGTQLPLPSGYFIALHTSDPTDAATENTEVSTVDWPSYARQSVGTPLSSAWSVISNEDGGGKQISNANNINFPSSDASGPITITHFSVYDAVTGGNAWTHAALTAPKTIDPTDVFSALPGGLKIIVR